MSRSGLASENSQGPTIFPTEAQRELKDQSSATSSTPVTFWKDLGPKVRDFLDSAGVCWTTVDVVRFIKVGEGEHVGPVVLWIGAGSPSTPGRPVQTSLNPFLISVDVRGPLTPALGLFIVAPGHTSC